MGKGAVVFVGSALVSELCNGVTERRKGFRAQHSPNVGAGGCLGVFDLHSEDSAHEYSALILFALIFKIYI